MRAGGDWLLIAGVAFLVLAGGGAAVVATNLPRGLRLNNPGNIEKTPPGGARWVGEIDSSDSRFAQFRTLGDGFRALGKLLVNYQGKYGLNTVRKIINRWAPPSENNTDAYVLAVAKAVGVGPDQVIDVRQHLPALLRAIGRHEQGAVAFAAHVPAAAIDDGAARALA